MKKIKAVVNVILSIFVVCYIIFIPSTVFVSLKAKQLEINRSEDVRYSGILELWNIDTFEGGSVGRTKWLEKRATEFESKNKGLFIVVNNLSLEQAKLNLEKGTVPDMVSFGIGAGEILEPYLNEYSGKQSAIESLLKAGRVNGKQYAIPYLLGAYFSFSNQVDSKETVVGVNGNNLPLLALLNKSDKSYEFADCSFSLDSYGAYEKYIQEKYCTLIGTQRDFVRINNRISNGKILEQNIELLSGFSDLVQYISICCKTTAEKEICTNFIEYITSSAVQKNIGQISMFSVLDENLDSSSDMRTYEKELKKNLSTINVFYGETKLNQIKSETLDALKGDKTKTKELNKILL